MAARADQDQVGEVGGAANGFIRARRWPNPFPRWFGYHEIFHLLVVAASTAHYLAIWRYVLPS